MEIDWVKISDALGMPLIIVLLMVVFGIVSWWLIRYYFKKQTTRDKARYEHELALKQKEFEIQFSKLHLDRADVIKELYTKLVWVEQAALIVFPHLEYTKANETKEEAEERTKKDRQNYVDKMYEFEVCFFTNKIYFDENICSLLSETRDMIKNKVMLYTRNINNERNAVNTTAIKMYWGNIIKEWDEFNDKMPLLKSTIEAEFRKLMGVSIDNK